MNFLKPTVLRDRFRRLDRQIGWNSLNRSMFNVFWKIISVLNFTFLFEKEKSFQAFEMVYFKPAFSIKIEYHTLIKFNGEFYLNKIFIWIWIYTIAHSFNNCGFHYFISSQTNYNLIFCFCENVAFISVIAIANTN